MASLLRVHALVLKECLTSPTLLETGRYPIARIICRRREGCEVSKIFWAEDAFAHGGGGQYRIPSVITINRVVTFLVGA